MVDNAPIADDPWRDPYEEQLNYTSAVRNVIDTNKALLTAIQRIADYSERQREKESPTIIDLSPTSGTPIANTFQTTVRMRVIGFILTGGGGDQFRLGFGARHFHFWSTIANMPFIQFPYTVDRGVDISMIDQTAPLAVAWSCYLFAYPE